MRRKDREINDLNEIINIVKACQVMRLGMVGLRGEPYVVPVNFGWELQDEQLILYFHGRPRGSSWTSSASIPRFVLSLTPITNLFHQTFPVAAALNTPA